MNNRLRSVLAATLAVSMSAAFSSAAAQSPDEDDAAPEGTVDRIDVQQQQIVIADGFFRLPSTARVYDRTNRTRSVLDVREGMRVRYSYEAPARQSGSQAPTITEIWILGEQKPRR